jgi:quercetin 2,3-dioxygenase
MGTESPTRAAASVSKQVVLETAALHGSIWPTIDPFLFCAYHLDHYPAGNSNFGPATSLTGRSIGMDFDPSNNWKMYHGETVPGFPAHPHRGFETVTYVRRGLIDHSDSLGAAARFGQGDTQWLTAGAGIVHAEMFPLVNADSDNPLELFQIWVNLPRSRKMATPSFSMRWAEEQPLFTDGMSVRIVAGSLGGESAPAAPVDSWAADSDNEFAIIELRGEPGTALSLPAASPGVERMVYVFGGSATIKNEQLGPMTVNRLDTTIGAHIIAGNEGLNALILQSRPIGEPVARHGPFVMNTRAELVAAYDDYQSTQFGGWPWDRSDPVHVGEQRFARHPDGRITSPSASSTPPTAAA